MAGPDLLDAWRGLYASREGGRPADRQRSKAEPGQIPEAWFYCPGFFLNEMPLAVVALCMVTGQGRAAECRAGYREKPSLKVCPTYRSHSMAHLRPPRGP